MHHAPAAPPRHGPRQTVLIVGSSGGHLTQMRALEPWWSKHDRVWVTFDMVDANSSLEGEEVVYAYHPTTRHIPNLLRNLWLAWRVLRRTRPDVIVSSGAGVALPFFLLGRLFGVTTAYIEVYDRIDTPSLTGRLCRPLSTLFFLQWEEQLRNYPGAVVIGRLL
ncbi:PssD/Cps14F family polysaccharide biosynthesis glycosyltransferase [Euzebya sp.]|uniref:PssD/Cps14F family polysaccharide biosynthesis glycosyltransferase n=1 Tax=Euzebya sp. TaxID=1971409 RepID=UPI00351260D8